LRIVVEQKNAKHRDETPLTVPLLLEVILMRALAEQSAPER
jgi:hypothetical protein